MEFVALLPTLVGRPILAASRPSCGLKAPPSPGTRITENALKTGPASCRQNQRPATRAGSATGISAIADQAVAAIEMN